MKKRNVKLSIAVVVALLFINSNTSAAKSTSFLSEKVGVLNKINTVKDAQMVTSKSGDGLTKAVKFFRKAAAKLKTASQNSTGRSKKLLEAASKFCADQADYVNTFLRGHVKTLGKPYVKKQLDGTVRGSVRRLYRNYLENPGLDPLKESFENMVRRAREWEVDIDDIVPPDMVPPITTG